MTLHQVPVANKDKVIIVGAGIGGLASSLRLSHLGYDVEVIERANSAGGKLRTITGSTGEIDIGPTVLTLLPIFQKLFKSVGEDIFEHIDLVRQKIIARHWWPDGTSLDLYDDFETSRDAIMKFSGSGSAIEFEKYFHDTRDLFSCFDLPVMQNPRPSMLDMNLAVLSNPKILSKLHPLRTLSSLLNYKFQDKRLRQLFGRYATYVGGSPLESPALLSLVWQAEAQGVWSIKGGMRKLARVIEQLAKARGASFNYGTDIKEFNTKDDRVVSITDTFEKKYEADKFIFNGDPRALALGKLGQNVKKAAAKEATGERSLSAYVWGFDAKVSGPDLVHHNVFFSDEPNSEFYEIKQGKMPIDPSIYICAQDRGKNAPYPNTERFEIILNAPPVSKREDTAEDYEKCKEITFKRLEMFGLNFQSKLKRANLSTPHDFEELFPASDGSLYGRSPHSLLATLKRPKCVTPLQNLFLVGGGVHPGAGVPMATLCAQLAVEEITKGQTSISTFPQMDMHGGTLTVSTR